jgi:hypothetical protein
MEDLLHNMLAALQGHARAREELEFYYLMKRLNVSLQNYYIDLAKDTQYLEARNESNLIRKLNKTL